MLKCSDCQGYLHYRYSNLPAYQVLNYSKTKRKFTCKRCANNDHKMLKEECIKGILETKGNEMNKVKRRIALQNNEVQRLKDRNQKKNSKFKSEKE